VVFAFLDCVISGKDNFKKRAYAAMDKTVADLKAENEEKVISLYQNDDYYRTVEETLKDETDGVTELLERIRIEELLKLFAQNEREVLTLLLDGFNISEISLSLKRSVSELESTMRSIRIKAADVLPAAA
jgi:DNA-directed RNA polymerase specialized sigma24 family protein